MNTTSGFSLGLVLNFTPTGTHRTWYPVGNGGPWGGVAPTTVERLPEVLRWMWDGDYCGRISFRWRPGTTDLPPTCLGHIGYGVPAWKRGRGHATRGLALLLPEVRAEGLRWVDLTADLDNLASHKVILRNGGVAVKRVTKPSVHGDIAEAMLFRIALA